MSPEIEKALSCPMEAIRFSLKRRERVAIHPIYLPDLLALCSRGEAGIEQEGARIFAVRV